MVCTYLLVTIYTKNELNHFISKHEDQTKYSYCLYQIFDNLLVITMNKIIINTHFYSCGQLEGFIKSYLNFKLDIIQITSGKLHGELSISKFNDINITRIKTNQGLLIYGDANSDIVNISLETSEFLELHRAQGELLPKNALSGFGCVKSEIYFTVSPGSDLFVATLLKPKFVNCMNNIHGECGVEYLHSQNIQSIKICNFQHIKSLFKTFLCRSHNSNEQVISDDFIYHISESLYQDINLPPDKRTKLKNPELAREFVQMTISNRINRPLCIDDLKNLLFTSKTVLSKSVRDATGLSPIAFVKRLRLEQIRSKLILHEELPHSVESLAKQYGFKSRGHFSRYYRDVYGELPSKTIQMAYTIK